MFNSKEEKVAIMIAREIVSKFNCECSLTRINGNNYLYLFNKHIDLLLTVCDTNIKKTIKIEELLIKEKDRNKGIGTGIINTMKCVALKYDATLGLWCELNNKRLFNFYSRLGFKYIETLDDDWLEFN